MDCDDIRVVCTLTPSEVAGQTDITLSFPDILIPLFVRTARIHERGFVDASISDAIRAHAESGFASDQYRNTALLGIAKSLDGLHKEPPAFASRMIASWIFSDVAHFKPDAVRAMSVSDASRGQHPVCSWDGTTEIAPAAHPVSRAAVTRECCCRKAGATFSLQIALACMVLDMSMSANKRLGSDDVGGGGGCGTTDWLTNVTRRFSRDGSAGSVLVHQLLSHLSPITFGDSGHALRATCAVLELNCAARVARGELAHMSEALELAVARCDAVSARLERYEECRVVGGPTVRHEAADHLEAKFKEAAVKYAEFCARSPLRVVSGAFASAAMPKASASTQTDPVQFGETAGAAVGCAGAPCTPARVVSNAPGFGALCRIEESVRACLRASVATRNEDVLADARGVLSVVSGIAESLLQGPSSPAPSSSPLVRCARAVSKYASTVIMAWCSATDSKAVTTCAEMSKLCECARATSRLCTLILSTSKSGGPIGSVHPTTTKRLRTFIQLLSGATE